MKRHVRPRALLFALTLLAYTLLTSGCPPPPPPPPPAKPRKVKLMILADVTKSLEESEVEKVAKLTADVLDRFPDSTEYVVYPIQRETERPSAIFESHPDPQSNVKLTDEDKTNRRGLIKKNIDAAFVVANKDQESERTCILNTLSVAGKYFAQVEAGSSGKGAPQPCLELVFISDMIEECNSNPLNVRINLRYQPITEAISLAEKMTALPDLSRVNVTVIIPTSPEATPAARHRPRLADLESFWNVIFRHCKFKEPDLKKFNWLPDIPERLNQPCG